MVLQPGQKPQWPFSNFNSTISQHFLLRHSAFTFLRKLRSDIYSLIFKTDNISHFCYFIFQTIALLFLNHMGLYKKFQVLCGWGFFCFAMVNATSHEVSTSEILFLIKFNLECFRHSFLFKRQGQNTFVLKFRIDFYK